MQFLHLKMGLEGMGMWLSGQKYLLWKLENLKLNPRIQNQVWKGLSGIPDGRHREHLGKLAGQPVTNTAVGKRSCLERWGLTWEVTIWPLHMHHDIGHVQVCVHVFTYIQKCKLRIRPPSCDAYDWNNIILSHLIERKAHSTGKHACYWKPSLGLVRSWILKENFLLSLY